MKKFFILLLFLITSCGYQPIYIAKDSKNYSFQKITLVGNNKINKNIVTALNFKEDIASSNSVVLTSDINISETSKNSKGQVVSYRTTVTLNFKIINNQNITKNRDFIKNFSYNNMKNKFKLSEYQKDVEKSLTGKIIEELIIYLNL